MADDIHKTLFSSDSGDFFQQDDYPVFQDASDAFFVTDPDGRIVYVNNQACAVTGFLRTELVNSDIWKHLAENDATANTRNIVTDEKANPRYIRRRNGVRVKVLVNIQRISFKRFLVHIRDYSLHQQSEQEKKLQESVLKTAFDYSPTGMAYTSLEGKWIKVNHALADMLGYTEAEMLHMDFRSITHPDDLPAELAKLEEAMHGSDRIIQRKKRYLRKNGTVLWANVQSSLLCDDSGKELFFVTHVEDITEKKNIEGQLQEKSELLYQFIKQSPIAKAMLDTELRFLMVSDKYKELYGSSKGEVTGKTLYEIFPRLPDKWRERFQRGLNGEVLFKRNEIQKRSDGKTEWINWDIRPWYTVDGTVGGVITYVEDVSGSIETEQLFRNLVEQSQVGVYIIQGYRFVYVNPRFAEIFGYTCDEMQELASIAEIVAPEEREKVNEQIRRRESGEITYIHYQTIGLRKDGSRVYTEAFGSTTVYKGMPAVIGSLLDITERKKTEEELKAGEEKFRTLIENTQISVFIIQDGKLKYINPVFSRLIGHPVESLLNNDINFVELIYPEDRARVLANIQDRLTGGSPGNLDPVRVIRADGVIRKIETIGSLIMYEDRPGVLGTAIDITDKLAEEERFAKAVTDAQENEKRLIGMELHDNVKQLLVACDIRLSFVQSKLAEREKAEEHLQVSRDIIAKAVHDLRDISHQLTPIVENGLPLDESIELLVKRMNLRSMMRVVIQCDETVNKVPQEVHLAFYRILQEQINNVVKYAQAGEVQIHLFSRENNILLRVADNGRGFDSRKKFDGIGFENIRRRAKALWGEMQVISSPGKGCELTVTIPVA